jgi:hypothetical protein
LFPGESAVEFVVEFEAGNKVLRATLGGVVTEQTLIELTAEVRRLLESQIPDVILVDLSDVTGFEISNEVVRFIARAPSALPEEIVRVIVAPQGHIFGVTRMFQCYADGHRPNVHVVKSLEEAYAYLGWTVAS